MTRLNGVTKTRLISIFSSFVFFSALFLSSVFFVDLQSAQSSTPSFNTNTWYTWYDFASSGMNGNWVLMANPRNNQTTQATISIGGEDKGLYEIAPGSKVTPIYSDTIGGPVLIKSTHPLLTSQRVVYQSSFNEVYGLPQSSLSSEYLFTWYDYASPGMNGNWILVANPSAIDTANVEISIGGESKGTYPIPPGGKITPSYPGIIGGPVRVVSTTPAQNPVPIFASQRVICQSSFNEVYGLPKSNLSSEYLFTWYDNASPGMNGNWILVANPSTSTANVEISIGGESKGTYPIPPGGKITPSYPGTIGGPVRVVSNNGVNILASQRVTCQSSFEELYGFSATSLAIEYLFTWYDYASPGMNGNWILVANPSATDTANVEIYIGGDLKGTYDIAPGEKITPFYPGTMGGLVRVVSTNSKLIYCSQRVICQSSFNEVFGAPLDLGALLPQGDIAGYTRGTVTWNHTSAQIDYLPNQTTREKVSSLLFAVRNRASAKKASDFIENTSKIVYPNTDPNNPSGNVSIRGTTAYFGTNNFGYANLSWTDGELVYEIVMLSTKGTPLELYNDIVTMAGYFP